MVLFFPTQTHNRSHFLAWIISLSYWNTDNTEHYTVFRGREVTGLQLTEESWTTNQEFVKFIFIVHAEKYLTLS